MDEQYISKMTTHLLQDFDNADTLSIDTLAFEEILQEEREKDISQLNTLSFKVNHLHTSLLYYRNAKTKAGACCYEAWKILVKKIGGSANIWKDLGHTLEISHEDLDYIANSVKEDPADIVLKVFMQNETATLDKIVDAFIELQRYDLLKAIEEPFCNLAQSFNKEDSGYHSEGKSSGTREIVAFTKSLKIDLPPALKKKFVAQDCEHPSLRPPLKSMSETNENNYPILFLTYTEDGIDTAINIQQYVNNWNDPVEILTLNGRREEVFSNPEKFIREYFLKADFIVPIITTGYLHRIKNPTPQPLSTNDNLDYKYVNFIYNLIINHYIYATGCLNKKVRSVLPLNENVDVLKEITMYPDLMPWTYEADFDELFKEFLKNRD